MSRGVLINTLDTYIGTALYEEFLGDNPEEGAYEIYGTYLTKDESTKPKYVKKMLKRAKPVLFRKYMREKMDLYIFDLHSGRLDDLKWAVSALIDEPLDSEKTLIVISSVLSWGGNEHKMIEVKPKKKKVVEEGEEEEAKEEGEEEKEEEEEEKEEEEGKEEEEQQQKEEQEEQKEPQYDENGNLIEEPEKKVKEFDEYGNEILVAQLDEEGNEILPQSDEDWEYVFEDEYKQRKEQERLEEERKRKEEEGINEQQEGDGGDDNKNEDDNNDKEAQNENDNDEQQRKDNDDDKDKEENEHNDSEEHKEDASDEGEGDGEGEEAKKERVYRRIIKIKKIKPKIYKRIGFREKDYKQRIPIEFYEKYKEYEDYLLSLTWNAPEGKAIENLNIYIICAGLPYGGCETIFNYFFKSTWLQNPIDLPYYGSGDNLIPTIHIKDLARIVKRLSDTKSESPYIFAIDKTKDKTLKNIISSMSINIGSGRTESIEYDKNLIRNLPLKYEDFYIDPVKFEKSNLEMLITQHELQWTRYLGIDVMLKPSKFIDSEFEWHCKEGIPSNSKKLLEEFCGYRKLRPLRIVMNCKDENYRKLYAEKLSQFYNIPVINFELIMNKLSQNIDELTQEEVYMNDKYFKLKERFEFLEEHPEYLNEANELLYDKTEIMFECLKYLLNSNAALNRGYVLEGIPVNTDEVEKLYYFKKEVKVEEGEEEEKPEEEEEEEVEEEEEKKDDEGNAGDDVDEAQKEEGDGDNKEGEGNDGEEKEQQEEGDNGDDGDANKDDDDKANEQQQQDEDKPNEQQEEGDNGDEDGQKKKKKKKKKVKKIKPKKYKLKFDKTLLPESVITLSQIEPETKEVENFYWEVEEFYQDNKIEILNLVYEDKEKDDPEEIFELMRIYVERNGRPFNYFSLKDEDINKNRITYVQDKQKSIEDNLQRIKEEEDRIQQEKEDAYWKKMEERIDSIKKDKEHLEQNEKVPTRKFLLVNIMPTLTKGLLEVCKINPIDPIDYLADFLFTNSTGESK